jgi:hypothetical protein
MTPQLSTPNRLDGQLPSDMAIDIPRDANSSWPEPVSQAESLSKTDKPGLQDFTSLVRVTRKFKSGAIVTRQRYRTQPAILSAWASWYWRRDVVGAKGGTRTPTVLPARS